MATLKDHTPYPIPHPQLLQLGRGGGRNGTERTNALPRAGLAGNKTTRRRWVRSTRPQTVLPSCAHTHTYTHSRLPAHKCPCKEPNGFPQLGLHAGNPDTFTATAWSAAGAQPQLPLCQDAPTQLWGWFCPVGANLVSLPPLFKTLRAATRPGEGAEHSPAQGSEPWRSLEWARPPWL